MRPNVALGASDAPNATLGALDATNATLGRSQPGAGRDEGRLRNPEAAFVVSQRQWPKALLAARSASRARPFSALRGWDSTS